MTELLTAAQMRAIEQAAIDSGEVTGLELLERAGQGAVDAILEEWPDFAKSPQRAVILCGPGNNGGDGFVIARLLKQRGWEVEVFLYGEASKLPPDAAENCKRWQVEGDVQPLERGAVFAASQRALETYEERDVRGKVSGSWQRRTVFVDALFGTGMARPFDAELTAILREWSEDAWEHGVAVDLPSGICADSGRPVGDPWLFCKLVAAFHAPKVGHALYGWQYDAHRLAVVDIGLTHTIAEPGDRVELLDAPELPGRHTYMGLHKESDGHKYSHGHTLVVAGPQNRTGAARLAARGALRIGAGLVTVAAHPDATAECAAQLTSIMLRQVVRAEDLAEILTDDRINALCLGPAMSLTDRTRQMVLTALAAERATVLDADALTVFAELPDTLFNALHEKTVLTPHGGEFARLFPDLAEKLAAPATKGPAYSKVDATREAAARAGCTILFKGADTVIASPDGRAAINAAFYDRSAPWLATAGSGDVLAGFIAGLLARGLQPQRAAETAAWLHVECARQFGPGLIAEDLPEQLPAVFGQLGLR